MSRYVPKPDPENINTPPQESVHKLGVRLAAAVFTIVCVYYVVGWAAEWGVTKLSVDTEMSLFADIDEELDAKSIDRLPELKALMKNLNELTGLNLHLGISCDPEPNAFAVPGGRIQITTGLLEKVQSENGLNFVLAHEIGHFKGRHHLRSIGRDAALRIMSLFLSFGDGEALFTDLAGDLVGRSYDRSQELEADAFALNLLQKHYGHVYGADEFFTGLINAFGDSDALAMITSTHPATSERRARILAMQQPPTKDVVRPSTPFISWIPRLGCF
jgi:beta-barrel assembly-enhancing protease